MKEQIPDYETVQQADSYLGDARRLLGALNLFLENDNPHPMMPHELSEPLKGIAWAALEKVNEASELLVPTK